MKITAIIQTRMSSTRLPGKVMKNLCGKPVIEHVIERVSQSKYINEVIIATTENKADDVIENKGAELEVKTFRGSEQNVLSRYYHSALEAESDIVVRLTSDCPLIDPKVIDEMLKIYLDNNYDLVTNAGPTREMRTFPRGLDTEIFSMSSLSEAFNKANKMYEFEHVTPFLYENTTNVYYHKSKIDYSNHRWTLDTTEDFQLVDSIYQYLYDGKHDFYLDEILSLFKKYPELKSINENVEQKNYLSEDKG